MLQINRLLLFVGVSILQVFLFSCGDDNPYPEEGDFYVFNLGSKVDAKYLGCGYEGYESCGDRVKKRVRQTVGNLSTERLVSIGDDIHKNHIPFPISSHEKSDWVVEVTERLKVFMENDNFDYNSFVVSSPDFNAFTIPGGNIYVTTGLLDMVSNKDELSYIIGHELGHNENNHTKESAYLMEFRKIKEQEDSYFATANSIVTSLFANSCGKSDELECDIASIYLLYRAGFDPEKALGGVDLLRRVSQPKTGSWAESILFAAFGSHPWSNDRSSCVKGYVRGSKVEIKCEQKFEDQTGIVTTRKSPLNIREYPLQKANKLAQIPKGSEIQVFCDCIKQTRHPKNDWYYVSYENGSDLSVGWVNKKYVTLK